MIHKLTYRYGILWGKNNLKVRITPYAMKFLSKHFEVENFLIAIVYSDLYWNECKKELKSMYLEKEGVTLLDDGTKLKLKGDKVYLVYEDRLV